MLTGSRDTLSWRSYLVEEIGAEAGVAAEPLVASILTALDDVAGDHAASVLQRSLPGELHRVLVLVLPRQVQRRTGTLCMGGAQKTVSLWSRVCVHLNH